MKIYEKILNVRKAIKDSDVKKAGRNDYGNYDYFTPEQIDHLTFKECENQGIFNKYQLIRTELGLIARMEVIDLESGEKEVFELATDIPQITATNISQQLGGAMTYSKRYLLMNIYDITDSNLDFDAQKPQGKSQSKPKQETNDLPWLNKFNKAGDVLPAYTKVIDKAKEQGKKMEDLLKFYKISRPVRDELKKDLS